MSVAQGIRLHPHHQAFASLRTHLLRSRRMLLMRVVSRPRPSRTGSPCRCPRSGRLRAGTADRRNLITQRTYVTLRHIERALNRMLDTSYGICHRCRAEILLSRLRAQPDAMLCVTCKSLSEERASLRNTAWRPDKPAEEVYRP